MLQGTPRQGFLSVQSAAVQRRAALSWQLPPGTLLGREGLHAAAAAKARVQMTAK